MIDRPRHRRHHVDASVTARSRAAPPPAPRLESNTALAPATGS